MENPHIYFILSCTVYVFLQGVGPDGPPVSHVLILASTQSIPDLTLYYIYQSCVSIEYMNCDFVQGPPGPGGLPGEVGKAGSSVSRDKTIDCYL